MLNGASGWMIFSFFVAGCLHEFLKPENIQKTAIGTKKISGVFYATVTGMFIPICSCGTIPLAISMYYSGVYLGPTLAFMVSTPIINPIALLLAFGMLGKRIAIIYLITGFVAPMIIGIAGNRLAGDELHINMDGDTEAIQLESAKTGFWEKLKTGMTWSFTDLSVTISKYTVSGMLIAGLIFNSVPQTFIQEYLGNPGFVSLLGITVVAALMYVCAVGHIPFIAALVASGASPGIAITFLMAGAGTNIPELLTISRTIGKRAMLIYFSFVVVLSNIAGYVANRILLPGFKPVLDYDQTKKSINLANHMIISMPEWVQYLCSFILIGYACVSLYRWVVSLTRAKETA